MKEIENYFTFKEILKKLELFRKNPKKIFSLTNILLLNNFIFHPSLEGSDNERVHPFNSCKK